MSVFSMSLCDTPGPSLLVARSAPVRTQCISIIFDVGVCTKSCRWRSVVVCKMWCPYGSLLCNNQAVTSLN
jgi:hypothetical protein